MFVYYHFYLFFYTFKTFGLIGKGAKEYLKLK